MDGQKSGIVLIDKVKMDNQKPYCFKCNPENYHDGGIVKYSDSYIKTIRWYCREHLLEIYPKQAKKLKSEDGK